MKNKKLNLSPSTRMTDITVLLCLVLFAFGAIYSVFGINGFMTGHLGWAGPDLYVSAVNLNKTHYFLTRGFYNNGTYELYNHHPPLGFIYFALVSYLGGDLTDKLAVAYLGAVTAYLIGWLMIYRLLLNFGLRKEAVATGILFVVTAPLFIFYRAIINFDCFNFLCSALLLLSFSRFELRRTVQSGRELAVSIGLLLFTVAMSWYSVPLIGLFFAWMLYKRIRNRTLRNEILKASFSIGAGLAILLGCMMAVYHHLRGNLDEFFIFIKADAATTSPTEEFRNVDHLIDMLRGKISQAFPAGFLIIVLALVVIVLLLARLQQRRGAIPTTPVVRPLPVASAIIMVLGIACFCTATRYWSAVHPFALLFLSAPFALFMAFFFNQFFKDQPAILLVFMCLSSLYSFYLFGFQRTLDVDEARNTQGLLTLFDQEFPSGYLFSKNKTLIGCGHFNTGMLIYVMTNDIWLPTTDTKAYAKKVDFDCVNEQQSIVRFHAPDKKKDFILRLGDPHYQTIDDTSHRR